MALALDVALQTAYAVLQQSVDEDLDMDDHRAAAERRSFTEIIADARILQARHVSDALGSAARWTAALVHSAGQPSKLDQRSLRVH